ncbi:MULTISPECIES: YozE family protein [Lentilactobacillus]|nr:MULTISPECIES: YozE family protein [Lentilactobacillus]MDB1104726.1 YozE family protein [Lentilactobacillus parabuchneri]
MSFYDWLQEFVDVNLPIGDFAKDAKTDKTFPKNVSD